MTDAETMLARGRDALAKMKVEGLPPGYLAAYLERRRDFLIGLFEKWLRKPVAPSPPAGPAAVVDRHNHLIVTIPGNTEVRHNHVVAALRDAKVEGIRPSGEGSYEDAARSKLTSIELLRDAAGRPYWQGALLMPWRKRRTDSSAPIDEISGPRHYAREALRQLGYDPIGRTDWKNDFAGGYDGNLVSLAEEARGLWDMDNPPWQVGDRVVGPEDRHGTVVGPCTTTIGPGCDVRWDLRGREKNDRRHQARVGVDKLSPEADPPPRIQTLKRLHKQHLSPRARRQVEHELAGLGLLLPYLPPLLISTQDKLLDYLLNSIEHTENSREAEAELVKMGYPATFATDLVSAWWSRDQRGGPMLQQWVAEELVKAVLARHGNPAPADEEEGRKSGHAPPAAAPPAAPASPAAMPKPPTTAAPASLARQPDPVIFLWAGRTVEAKRLEFDNEAAALAYHAAVGGAVGRQADKYYWTDNANYFLKSGIAPLLRDPPPAVPPTRGPAPARGLATGAEPVKAEKATLYALNTLGEVIAIEVKDLEYSPAAGLTFNLPGKRKRRRFAAADGFAVVLKGWGHPDFRTGPARLRPQAFGVELARFLTQYPADVLVDLRRDQDRPPADAAPSGKPAPLRITHGEIALRVRLDRAYQNAMANSDRQNARIEMEAALARVMLNLFQGGYVEQFKQYSDDKAHKRALEEEMFKATYKPPAPAAPPKPSEWAPRIATMIMQALDISQGELTPQRLRAYQERDRESGITKADWDAAIRLLLNQRKIRVFTDGTIRLPETDAEEMERLRHRAATLGIEFSYEGDDAPPPKPPALRRPAPPPAPPGDEAAQLHRLRQMIKDEDG